MEYVPFASHPLKVSKLCLGTMMFGEKCDEAASHSIVQKALECGVNFFDTAAMYSSGVCETYLGRTLAGVPRETVFVTTKVVKGIDRHSILESIDESLRRLQMDYVDLYLVHWPVAGMDITEMMGALSEVVQSGKTRLVGCCNFPAYLLASANRIAAEHGWAPLANNQVAYNLIERGVEVEILPQALLDGIAITAYRPLAIGLLTGRYRPGTPLDAAGRGALDSRVITWLSQHGASVERFIDFAGAVGVEPAQLAIAWVNYSPAVAAPIVGVSSVNQLDSSLKGVEFHLSESDYKTVTQLFDTEVKEEGMQLFPGLKFNFPRLRRKLFLAHP